MDKGKYFATLPTKDLAQHLSQRIEDNYAFSRMTGRTLRLIKSYALYNGMSINNTGAIAWGNVRGGEQGELIFSVENHYRNIANNLLTITTAQRPTIQCSAVNSDYKSLAQAILANGLIDYYLTERRVETLVKQACKYAIEFGEGFISVEWDATAGDPYMVHPEQGQKNTGDIKFTVYEPMDIIRDDHATGYDSLYWIVARRLVSKFELAAKYPELADDIIKIEIREENLRRIQFATSRKHETDLIPVYSFWHKKGPAVPQGRETIICSNDVVLFDGPLPYSEIPLYRITPDEMDGTPFGTTPMYDLIGPQEAINGLDTAMVTNSLGRGIGNMLMPSGANVSVDQIASSMNVIKYEGNQEPKPLAWPAIQPEIPRLKQDKIAAMEVLSGINSVVRGSPSEAIGQDASGAKLALIQAQAIQSNSGLQSSYANLLRDVAMAIIDRLRIYGGQIPRQLLIAGKWNNYLPKEFVSDDLRDVRRVTVDVGNPLMRTVSGKMSIADKFAELGFIKSPEQYLMLVKAGTYEPLIENEQSQIMRIRQENEQLMEGKYHKALISDPHWIEIPQHLSVLDNPTLREAGPENEAIQQAVLNAVSEHLELFKTMPPELVLMRGGQAAFEMWNIIQGAGMAPMAQPGMPPEIATSAQAAPEVMNPEASQPAQPGLPSLPINPATGEQVQIPTPG